MKSDKPKTAIISVAILVGVCAGSFFAVRSLNTRMDTPTTVYVPTSVTTTVQPTQATEQVSDALVTQTTLPTTLPGTTVDSLVTTFENVTLPSAQTTVSEASTAPTSTLPTSTEQASTLPTANVSVTGPVTEEQAQEVIKSAAVFSDGFLGYKFDTKGQYYYTSDDPWQRNFGFNILYDIGAPFVNFYYDTIRCKFSSGGKDWMIQFWKGQYGLVFVGGEIGVYNKPAGRTPEHYDCASDEDSLYMSMTLFRKGEEKFTRNYAKYWWCTGFIPGTLDSFSDRSELTLQCRITMKDKDMRKGFCNALAKNGYVEGEDFSVSGLDVYFSWT